MKTKKQKEIKIMFKCGNFLWVDWNFFYLTCMNFSAQNNVYLWFVEILKQMHSQAPLNRPPTHRHRIHWQNHRLLGKHLVILWQWSQRLPATHWLQSNSPVWVRVRLTEDYYADPEDCSKFYQCDWETAVHHSCNVREYFNPVISNCDYQDDVQCNI